MSLEYDAVLLLGFGGPEGIDEVKPFVDRVLGDSKAHVPVERYNAVVERYLRIGGRSPYNKLTHRQAFELRRSLRKRHAAIPVEIAFRNASPYIEDVVERLARKGMKRVLGVVMAPHHGSASSEKYQQVVTRAQESLGPAAPTVDYATSFFEDPLFVRAHANRIGEARLRLPFPDRPAKTIFTAHSIPCRLSDSSTYACHVLRTASLIAENLKLTDWCIAYQSRSGAPNDPWLEPDVRDVLRSLPDEGFQQAVVSPIGFLCDHFEVLYDLDIDAARVAQESDVRMVRATALNDHPAFIRMLTERIVQAISA